MKKQILIAITVLLAGGACLSVNAISTEDGCASGLRRTFDGAGRAMGPRTDRPSVRPETGAPDQPRFAGSSSGAPAGMVAPAKPQNDNKRSKYNAECKDLKFLGILAALAGFGIFVTGVVFSNPVVAFFGLGLLVASGITAIVVNSRK